MNSIKICLLSDTHSYLDDRILSYAKQADEVWHAGDWGVGVAEELESLKPTKGVYGNIDDNFIRSKYNEWLYFETYSLKIAMCHIGGNPSRYAKGVLDRIKNLKPDVFICGHSHIPIVQRTKHGFLHINPGAAGRHGFHKVRTLINFEIIDSKIQNMQLVELGARSKIIE